MLEQEQAFAYHLLRYTPNAARDEYLNVGVVLHDPRASRVELRLIENDSEFARLRRIHPSADMDLVRGLEEELRAQLAAQGGDATAWLARLDQTLSGVLQLSPRRAVLSVDFDAELDRLYRNHVEPVRGPGLTDSLQSRVGIRTRVADVFRQTGILERMQRNVRAEEFTHPGDPMRLDFAYRQNGTRGFVQALALDRDPAHVKALAFTSARARKQSARVEFTAIAEAPPQDNNPRHRFVVDLCADEGIQLVPLPDLPGWARDLGARLH